MQSEVPCCNCGKLIPKVRLIVHETFCVKHMMKCPQCPEIIYKNELEEHIEEDHSHSKCLYCDIELKIELLHDHVIACGSRTDTCAYCQRNITRLEFQDHIEICAQVFQATADTGISMQNPSELVRQYRISNKKNKKQSSIKANKEPEKRLHSGFIEDEDMNLNKKRGRKVRKLIEENQYG
jgi:hypothetical protein